MSESLRLALCAHQVLHAPDFDALAARLEDEVAQASAAGAGLIIFPEYGSMELTALPGMTRDPQNVPAQILAMQKWRDPWVEIHQAWSDRHQITIVAGSFPWQIPDGSVVNRAWITRPGQSPIHQDKFMMTRFEREQWGVRGGGSPLTVFEACGTKMAVAICYDVEFPLLVRAAVEAGAMIILNPSNTDGLHGYHRVRTGAQARAMENQCLVAMVPLIGAAAWTTAIDINVGRAGLFGPIDLGFPEDGILALGPETGGLLLADAPLRRLDSVRRHGQNLNHADWRLSVRNEPLMNTDGH